MLLEILGSPIRISLTGATEASVSGGLRAHLPRLLGGVASLRAAVANDGRRAAELVGAVVSPEGELLEVINIDLSLLGS